MTMTLWLTSRDEAARADEVRERVRAICCGELDAAPRWKLVSEGGTVKFVPVVHIPDSTMPSGWRPVPKTIITKE